MTDWLDTETKAILQGVPPEKLAPAATDGFSLLIVEKGFEPDRIYAALEKVPGLTRNSAGAILRDDYPILMATGLSYRDAQRAQFELYCCDTISLLFRDELVRDGIDEEIRNVCGEILHSHDFKLVKVEVRGLLGSYVRQRFASQFLGTDIAPSNQYRWEPITAVACRRKATLMAHWAQKFGGTATVRAL